MENSNAYSLSEVLELYCLHQFNDKKKGAAHILPMAKLAWEEIFLRTIWNNFSKWVPLLKGDPYPYLEVPDKAIGISVWVKDDCGNTVLCSTNNKLDVFKHPVTKSCGCKENCNCGSLCGSLNALSFETRDVIIDGITYTERTWLQVCKNGEVLKWRKTPVKEFIDQNTSSIQYKEISESVCTLEVKPCGCVTETEENKKIISEKCGCSIVSCKSKTPVPHDGHGLPEIKFGDDGNKIFINNHGKYLEFMINYQLKEASADCLVPFYCLDLMFAGIYKRTVKWNPRKNRREKEEACDAFDEERKKTILFLNPIRLENLERIQGERKPW